MRKIVKTLLLSGGGIRAIASFGALQAIYNSDEYDLDIDHICGVSAGSIVGVCLLMNYSFEEIIEEIKNKNFIELKTISYINFLSKWGLDSGKNIISWIETLLIKKAFSPKITFIEFFNIFPVKFSILAGNLNKYHFEYFNHLNTPNMIITDAIRMSMSLPFIFTMQQYKSNIIVDGGVISNYPIHLFTKNIPNFCSENDIKYILGLKLVNHGEHENHVVDIKITSFEKYLYNVISCYIIQKEKKINEMFKKHTIFIETGNCNSTVNFNLSIDEKEELLQHGRNSVEKHFEKHFEKKSVI